MHMYVAFQKHNLVPIVKNITWKYPSRFGKRYGEEIYKSLMLLIFPLTHPRD